LFAGGKFAIRGGTGSAGALPSGKSSLRTGSGTRKETEVPSGMSAFIGYRSPESRLIRGEEMTFGARHVGGNRKGLSTSSQLRTD